MPRLQPLKHLVDRRDLSERERLTVLAIQVVDLAVVRVLLSVRFQLLCEPGQGKPSHMYMQAHTHSYAHAHANVHAGMHTRAHIEAQIGEVNAWGAVVILIWFNN